MRQPVPLAVVLRLQAQSPGEEPGDDEQDDGCVDPRGIEGCPGYFHLPSVPPVSPIGAFSFC